MTIHVERHGGRWAVKTNPDEMPVSEYETRAAAESAARAMGDPDIVVSEDDPSGVPPTPPSAEPVHRDEARPGGTFGVPSTERPRENQSGL